MDRSRPMFQTYYQFREQPFGVNPDPRFLYLSRTHREAFSSLLYRVQSDSGFLAMIAQPGMGKTTLLFHLLQKLQGTAKTAFIFQTQCTSHELLRHVLSEFECDTSITDTVRMSQELKLFLLAEANAGRRCVLVIDEAQNLGPEVLETIRLLSNFETPRRKLLNIILSGQLELGELLDRTGMNQLRQRLSCMIHLQRFTSGEAALYIAHRLTTAGYPGKAHDLFSLEALAAIAQLSDGIPRVINNLCFNALSLGYALEASQIDLAIVEEAADDLGITNRPRLSHIAAGECRIPLRPGPRSVQTAVECGQEQCGENGLASTVSPFGRPEAESGPPQGIPPEAISEAFHETCDRGDETGLISTGETPRDRTGGASKEITTRSNTREEPEATRASAAEALRTPVDQARDGLPQVADQRRRRNPTRLAVVGGSLCVLVLCIGAPIRIPSRHSVSARTPTITSAQELGALTPVPQERSVPPPAVRKVSRNAPSSRSYRRHTMAYRIPLGDRDKRAYVDLALASYAPEPLIKPLALHPMAPSALVLPIAVRVPESRPADDRSSVQGRSLIAAYIPAKAIWQPAPTYSRATRQRIGPNGEVQLLLSVSRSGEVSKVGVLDGNYELVKEAVKAVKAWRYRPASFYGAPVNSQVYITVRFQQQ